MNQTFFRCGDLRVVEYLNERMNERQQLEFEAHLVDCTSCRAELDRLAADPDTWREVAELLRPAPDDEPLDEVLHAASDDDASMTDSPSASRRSQATGVLDLLTPTDDPEMLGRLGEYEISGVIGVGGMGAVLKGFDKSLRRVVAIKVMAPHLAGHGSARARFQREARAAAAITHDNVIDIYGVSEANGLPYLVMPYAKGPSLQKRIDNHGPLDAAEVVRIGRQIASGLAAAHDQGLVHRDIKPANILLVSDGIERLCITDFGVARAIDDASMTNTGLIAGTPQYMSPEQARGESVDHRSDLFSLGSVLYTACTGRPPFRSDSAYGILRRITDSEPRPIREINPEVPDWLCRIISRLMAKHPADRFESAQEVAELLDTCLAHMQRPSEIALPDVLVSHPPRPLRAQPRSLMKRYIRRGVMAMVALFGLLAGWGMLLQVSKAPAISGNWSDDEWSTVSLVATDQSPDWYTGTFTDNSGETGSLQLQWSRLQRRFNGEWKSGEKKFGTITVRPDSANRLVGAITMDPAAETTADFPRLREFTWHESTEPLETVEPREGDATPLPETTNANSEITDGHEVSDPNSTAATDDLGIGMTRSPNNAYATPAVSSTAGAVRVEVASLFGPASELARRLREAREGIRETSVELSDREAALVRAKERLQSATEQLNQLQSQAKAEGRDLRGFDSQTLENLQRDMRSAQRTLDSGEANRLAWTERFKGLQAQLAGAEAERNTIVNMLEVERKAAVKNLELAQNLLQTAEQRFADGSAVVDETLKARQDIERLEAEVVQLELLLEFYRRMGNPADEPAEGSRSTTEEDITRALSMGGETTYLPRIDAGGLPRPTTEAERTAMAKLLAIQFEVAMKEREQARIDLDRIDPRLVTQEQLDRAQLAVDIAEGKLRELQVKYKFVTSFSFSPDGQQGPSE